MAKSFNDLAAFRLAIELADQVYEATAGFPANEIYGLAAQLRRAAVGVFSQIAEGNGRITYGEWRQFLSQARGSLFEIEAHLRFAQRRGYITDVQMIALKKQMSCVSRAILGLLRWVLEKSGDKEKRDFSVRCV